MQRLGQRHGRQSGGRVEAPETIQDDERFAVSTRVGRETISA